MIINKFLRFMNKESALLLDSFRFTPKNQQKHVTIKYETLTPMQALEKIREMRTEKNAPVDLIGSHLQPMKNIDDDSKGFQLLVSLILSVQTKDQTTDLVMNRLKEKGLSVDFLDKIDQEDLKKLIFEINFNNNKAKYLKNLASIVKNDYNYKMPTDYNEVLKFPGVGHKIAVLYMQHHLNQTVGIAVDTHVHRISNRLEWVETKTPNQTMSQLEKIFDKEIWKEINELLVGFGQTICLPINPKCEECLLKDACPEKKKLVQKKKRIKK